MTAHPFYPTNILLPEYVPAMLAVEVLLGVFFSIAAAVMLGMWLIAGTRPHLSSTERLLICWWTVTGLIHTIIEGWVVANKDFYKDSQGGFLNEVWKEYAKADSRYATRDAFVIQMELVTAYIEGPLCFMIVYGIFARKPWRFTLMMLVSTGQLYGDVLYYLTCFHEGVEKHSRPEVLYFWGYFVFLNAIWIVVPATIIGYAAKNINAAVAGNAQKKVA